ncbi:MAG: hypothetical protein B7X69_04600 [Sulfurovum sp. 39-42-12]|jgi:hypothetical protein|nr:MAG: hypothetical protein B7Y63_00440 [Sulfurovum sp. 35-42-20]OYZ25680.1 MAG: hypothetical protein B7Y23_04740 [Sulfurovum sp. 16-42-52]OYZ50223.1 MAG: hypothetical protein B7Y13_01815 [Sulfurovum sp. 24-42-9]OZA45797.1 MAG: hypothetical protein B7X80_04380 [Sulfurovum sp. 17-42-90]OZA60269.1 MAG: hypothetical protein B7X69_04600 [Sulfurovum sp. 39-42-12]
MKKIRHLIPLILVTTLAVHADEAAELAKKLTNPIAALISVPFQLNYDENIGINDGGKKWLLNIQPVIPIEINDEWNVISRTILPVVWKDDIIQGSGRQNGIGDTVQSFFISPKAPSESGWIWGAGPVFLFPTGRDELLSSEKWGAGPTAVALKQDGAWTYGGLANHIWSFAGAANRADISSTYLQPFVSYVLPTHTTFTLSSESTYDWKNEQWSVPINGIVSQIVKIKDAPVSVFAGIRYWADAPQTGPEGFGFRAGITLLFPK